MKITKKQVIKAIEIIEEYHRQQSKKLETYLEKDLDKRSILTLNLNTRENNSLIAEDIQTIGDLLRIDRHELRKLRNLGNKGIVLINNALKYEGIETDPFSTR